MNLEAQLWRGSQTWRTISSRFQTAFNTHAILAGAYTGFGSAVITGRPLVGAAVGTVTAAAERYAIPHLIRGIDALQQRGEQTLIPANELLVSPDFNVEQAIRDDFVRVAKQAASFPYPGYPHLHKRWQVSAEEIARLQDSGQLLPRLNREFGPEYAFSEYAAPNDSDPEIRRALRRGEVQMGGHDRSVNPHLEDIAPVGVAIGPGALRRDGANATGDTVLLNEINGTLYVTLIRRKAGSHEYASPGGFLNSGEAPKHAAIREVREETKHKLHGRDMKQIYDGPAADERMTATRYVHTTAYVHVDTAASVEAVQRTYSAEDDADRVVVVPVTEALVNGELPDRPLYGSHGTLLKLAVQEYQRLSGKVVGKNGQIGYLDGTGGSEGTDMNLQSQASDVTITGHMSPDAGRQPEGVERVPLSRYHQVFDGAYAERVAALNGSGMPQLLDSRSLIREIIRRRTTPLRRMSESFLQRSFSPEEGEKWEREYVASLGEAAEELYSRGMSMPVFRVDKRSVIDDPTTMSRMMLPVLWESRVHKPKGIIQISGGAKGLNLTQFDSTEKVLDTLGKPVPAQNGLNAYRVAQLIYEAASENEMAILTGGTQSGIMQAISAIHVYESTMQALPASDTRNYARTLGNNRGVGLIEAQELPILVHVAPEKNTVITGNDGVEYEYNAPYGICPGTAGFLVSGVGFGGEGPGLDQAAAALGYVPAQEGIASELQAQTDRNSRIVAVINGGQLTLNEVENALSGVSGDKDPKAKFLFMAGTERSADWLSSMLQDPNLTADEIFRSHPNDSDLKGNAYRESLDRVAGKLRTLYQKDSTRVAIVDVKKANAEYELRGAIQALLSTRI